MRLSSRLAQQLENALRNLVGDEYFHIAREHHNLDRCRTQCKLVSDMEAHWDELEAIVAKYRKG